MAKAAKQAAPTIMSVNQRIRSSIEDMKLGLDLTARNMMYEKRHKGKKVVQLAAEMKSVGMSLDYIDELHKYLQAEYDVLRLRLIPDQIDNENLVSPVNVAGVGKVVITPDVLVSVKEGNQPKLFSWLKKNRLGDLIQDTLNSSTLKAFIKGRLIEGKPIPKEFLNVTPISRASIQKG